MYWYILAGVALCFFCVGSIAVLDRRRAGHRLYPKVSVTKASIDSSAPQALRQVRRLDEDKDKEGEEGGGQGEEKEEERGDGTTALAGENELKVEKDGANSSICSPVYVAGVENCSHWKGEDIVPELLGLKRDMLRGVLRVLEDPKSSGEGGDPSKPLLLVQRLAIDEADAVTGASSPLYLGEATDAGGWNPELGGMNRWLERYYWEILKGARPVIVHVHVSAFSSLTIAS